MALANQKSLLNTDVKKKIC